MVLLPADEPPLPPEDVTIGAILLETFRLTSSSADAANANAANARYASLKEAACFFSAFIMYSSFTFLT